MKDKNETGQTPLCPVSALARKPFQPKGLIPLYG